MSFFNAGYDERADLGWQDHKMEGRSSTVKDRWQIVNVPVIRSSEAKYDPIDNKIIWVLNTYGVVLHVIPAMELTFTFAEAQNFIKTYPKPTEAVFLYVGKFQEAYDLVRMFPDHEIMLMTIR